jgi:ribosomal protein S18 acetylase RimI-like enzyme
MMPMRLRVAGPADAEDIALLHAESWRRHYRGAYTDAYLDGDVLTDRRSVWFSRLAAPTGAMTAIAEDDTGLVGFVHVVFDEDVRWGSLIDNLHVTHNSQRTGLGTALLAHAAEAAVEQATGSAVYLWVQEQNLAAQQFYQAMHGTFVGKALISPPGNVPSRLNGTPHMLRCAWPDASSLTRSTGH